MGALIANLGRIQGDLDIHLLLTHHQPAEKERMRGHGALLGAVDTTVHITKTTAGRLAEVVKSSDHEEGQRVAFFLKGVTVDTDEQGDPITAPVVIEAMAGVAPKKKAVLPNGAKVAINALQEAIGDLGVIPPASNYIPPATKAVNGPMARLRLSARHQHVRQTARQATGVPSRRETVAGRKGNRDLGTACMDCVRQTSHGEQCEHSYRSVFALFANMTPAKCSLCSLCSPCAA